MFHNALHSAIYVFISVSYYRLDEGVNEGMHTSHTSRVDLFEWSISRGSPENRKQYAYGERFTKLAHMLVGADKKKKKRIVEQDSRLEIQIGFLCFNIEATFLLLQKHQSLLLRPSTD